MNNEDVLLLVALGTQIAARMLEAVQEWSALSETLRTQGAFTPEQRAEMYRKSQTWADRQPPPTAG